MFSTVLLISMALTVWATSTSSGSAGANSGFLGCATKEIAEHFGKYFGMLITTAKYADIVKGFEIIESKYII